MSQEARASLRLCPQRATPVPSMLPLLPFPLSTLILAAGSCPAPGALSEGALATGSRDRGASSELLFQILVRVPLRELFRGRNSLFFVSKQWLYVLFDPVFWHALSDHYFPQSMPDALQRKRNHMSANYCKLRLRQHCTFEFNFLHQIFLLSATTKPSWRDAVLEDPHLMPWLTFDWLAEDGALLPGRRTGQEIRLGPGPRPQRLAFIFPIDSEHWATLVPGDCGALIFNPQKESGQLLVSLPSVAHRGSGLELAALASSPLLPLIASTLRCFVTVSRGGAIRLWHKSSGLFFQALAPVLHEEVSCLVAFATEKGEKEWIACGSTAGTVSTWTRARGVSHFSLALQQSVCDSIASLCPLSRSWLIVCCWNHAVFLVHLLSQRVSALEAPWHDSPVTSIGRWAPAEPSRDAACEDSSIAVGLQSGAIFLSRVDSGGPEGLPRLCATRCLRGHGGPVTCLEFEHVFRAYLLSSSLDSTVRAWSRSTGACVAVYELANSPIWGFRFYYGRMFVSTASHRLLHVSFLSQPTGLK